MYRIALINMPFAALYSPSLALTQLKAVVDGEYGERVSVDILYLNHDFARYIGVDLYERIGLSVESLVSGAGEWFFRQLAFPELTDNTERYFLRYFPRRDEQSQMLKRLIREKRQGLDYLLDELIAKYNLEQAELVGFTSTFFQNVASFAMARRLKERNPDIITVMGGANCETPMGQEIAKNVEQIDFVFSGPALKSFPEFVRHCLDGEIEKCNTIDGVFSRTNYALWPPQPASDESKHIGPIGEEFDINVEIELDYGPFLDTLENNFPDGRVEPPILLFETSRGCWWGERSQCAFCGLNGMTVNFRAMNPEGAIAQFESLFKYSSRCSRFEAVDNSMPKNYLREVFPFLDTPPNVRIMYEVRPDLSEEDMQVLSKAGVRFIQPGVEALATSTLKLIRKGTTVFQNLLLLKHCVMYDVYPYWNLLLGIPGEDEEIYRKYLRDMPLLMHLPPPAGVYPVRFDRYSPYFVRAEQYGLDLHPNDFYQLIYPFGEEVLSNLAYYFVDRNFRAEYYAAVCKWIDKIREQFAVWWTRWHGEDQLLPPRLFFKEKGKSTIVYDSRSGKVVEHHVGDVGRQVLEHLTKSRRITDLAADLSHIPNLDPDKEIAFLQDRGLVFQEGERFMSLVLPEEPPPTSFKLTGRSEVVEKVKDSGAQPQKPELVRVSRKAHRMKRSSLKRENSGSASERKG